MTTIGRPSKLNPEMIQKLSKYVRDGNYFCTAAELCDIDDSSLMNWMKQGRLDYESDTPGLYLDLIKSIKRAQAENEAERIERVLKAGEGGAVVKRLTRTKRDGTSEVEEEYSSPQWLADITFLERRYRERWGRPAPIAVQVNDTKIIQISRVEVCLSEPSTTREVVDGEVRELLPEP